MTEQNPHKLTEGQAAFLDNKEQVLITYVAMDGMYSMVCYITNKSKEEWPVRTNRLSPVKTKNNVKVRC